MINAQKAANEEDKSSVGDKYETGRAMMQRPNAVKGRVAARLARQATQPPSHDCDTYRLAMDDNFRTGADRSNAETKGSNS